MKVRRMKREECIHYVEGRSKLCKKSNSKITTKKESHPGGEVSDVSVHKQYLPPSAR